MVRLKRGCGSALTQPLQCGKIPARVYFVLFANLFNAFISFHFLFQLFFFERMLANESFQRSNAERGKNAGNTRTFLRPDDLVCLHVYSICIMVARAFVIKLGPFLLSTVVVEPLFRRRI